MFHFNMQKVIEGLKENLNHFNDKSWLVLSNRPKAVKARSSAIQLQVSFYLISAGVVRSLSDVQMVKPSH